MAASRRATISRRKRIDFFDLPGELRNDVYHYALLDGANRRITLYGELPCSKRAGTVMALLHADGRILAEAGSYYFTKDRIEFVLDSRHASAFLTFFAAIGPMNQARLARNANVTLRLMIETTSTRKNTGFTTARRTWQFPLKDVADTAKQVAELSLAQRAFPAVGEWTFVFCASGRLSEHSREQMALRHMLESGGYSSKRLEGNAGDKLDWLTRRVYAALAALVRKGMVSRGKKARC